MNILRGVGKKLFFIQQGFLLLDIARLKFTFNECEKEKQERMKKRIEI